MADIIVSPIDSEADTDVSPIPMISPTRAEHITSNGTIEMPATPDGYDLPPRRGWFNSKFNHLYCLIFVVALIMLAVLVLCIILVTGFAKAESRYTAASKEMPTIIEKLIEKFRSEQLAAIPPGLAAQLAQFTPPAKPATQKMDIDPVNAQSFGPETTRRKPTETHRWHDPKCTNHGKCSREGYEKPPLVILSFDGFSREYLDRGIVKSLQYLADCGATAERVIPSYPTRTFPNHYTMATGLYPESHGIVDNSVFDPTISPTMESMKSTKHDAFWVGDPIWSIYGRETGRPTACMFWPGCLYNATGLPPTVAPAYNKDFPFRNRLNSIMEWLQKPAASRPGLIMAYFDQPDTAGHYQVDEKDVNQHLMEMDRLLDQFMTRLHEEGLMECVNLVIVSDHGMQLLNKTIYYEDHVKMDGIIGAKGVVGRLHRDGTALSVDDLTKTFECKRGEDLRVFPRQWVPTRKHYSRTARVGDVILQGEPGTAFYRKPSDDYHLSADHGYDYLLSTMHTIFFARGPSIKKNVVIPEIQNVEYLNLWMDLLDLKKPVDNNGTLGMMDEILVNPPRRATAPSSPIRECKLSLQVPGASGCGSCSKEQTDSMSKRLFDCSMNLPEFQKEIPQFSSHRDICFENYCTKTLLTGQGNDPSVALVETLTSQDKENVENCEVSNRKYVNFDKRCSQNSTGHYLSVNDRTEFSRISNTKFAWSEGFVKTVVKPLNNLTSSYVQRFGKIVSITGVAYDSDMEGIADDMPSTPPTHFYRILINCEGGKWGTDGYCNQSADMNTLAFIFPTSLDRDINCLPIDKFLFEYSSRIKDVELISGMEFVPRAFSRQETLRIRSKINMNLW